MTALSRILHNLALALWFGMGFFFTFVVGLSLFATFERRTEPPPDQRPLWLPAATALEKLRPSATFPEPLRKEQGSRIAGAAVGPMFLWYYAMQIGCGIVALLTALGWRSAGTLHRWRVLLLLLALVGAGGGWWLERRVEELRGDRERASDLVLQKESPNSEELQQADLARTTFGRWHTYSLFANFGTLGLVLVVTIMTAYLPNRQE